VPALEPSDSQEAYELMAYAFDISENFDTPVMMRLTTRICHSKSVVKTGQGRVVPEGRVGFRCQMPKYVMVPAHARLRHPLMEERLVKLAAYAETLPLNQVIWGDRSLGVVTSGIAYQYAREIFPEASFFKLGMTYPLPENLLRYFANQVDKLVVIEELDPFLEENIRAMGIEISGKEFIPAVGELNPDIIEAGARRVGLIDKPSLDFEIEAISKLPKRPPLLCSGCPHTGLFFTLSNLGKRSKVLKSKGKAPVEPKLVITGDIGCYTLGAYPPLNAMDTCACMGASIGQALGMAKAGIGQDVVAVIGDSTFMHSGITSLVNAVYNEGRLTVVILDNGTTAMTGHQHHPGSGVSAQGKETRAVPLEGLVRGMGISDVKVVSAFDMKALRTALRSAVDNPELSVLIVRGSCAVRAPRRGEPMVIDTEKCNRCELCLRIGCPAIQKVDGQIFIDPASCVGDTCTICQQICPQKAITAPIKAGITK